MAFSFGAPAAQPAQSAGSLFGNTNNASAPAKPAFSFGAAPAASTTQPSTSLFGSTAPANNAQPAAGTSGGLFGSTTNQPAQQQQQSGGLFGSTTQQPAQQSGSLFGNTGTNNTSQPAQTSSLFGGAAKPAGGLFGSTAPAAQPAQGGNTTGTSSLFGGGGLFGQNNQQQQQQQQQQPQAGGLFGSTTQPQQQQTGGLFGSTAQPNQQLGQSLQQKPNALNQSTLFSDVSHGGLFEKRPEQSVEERVMAVKNGWDPAHPDCKLKFFFYNVVQEGTASQYGRPQNAPEDKWNIAMRDNPDRNRMVPVLATGWDDVKKRMGVQEQVAGVHQAKMKELSQAITSLSQESSLKSTRRLGELQRRLTDLQHRLIRLSAQTLPYNPALSSSTWKPDEARMKSQLDNTKAELEGRGSSKVIKQSGTYSLEASGYGTPIHKNKGEGRMSGQVNELWGMVEEIRRRRRQTGSTSGGEGWLADERVLEEITKVLGQQQEALTKLSQIVKSNEFDVRVIDSGLKEIGR